MMTTFKKIRTIGDKSALVPPLLPRLLASGFTLIEVLVAMTVLSVIVLMAANIFQSSSAAWNIGTQKADINTAARAALDFMVRELACAVAGPVEATSLTTPINIPFRLSDGGTKVMFVALSGNPANGRALRGHCFQHVDGEKTLKYECFTNNDVYNSPFLASSGSGLQLLITNVLSLSMSAFTNASDLAPGGANPVVAFDVDRLPVCLDVAIVMLSDDDMRRYWDLKKRGVSTTDLEEKNSKVYSTRISFPNRAGYGAR